MKLTPRSLGKRVEEVENKVEELFKPKGKPAYVKALERQVKDLTTRIAALEGDGK